MEGNFKYIAISVLLILVFISLLVSFTLQLGSEYAKDTTEINQYIDLDKLNNTFLATNNTVNYTEWSDKFSEPGFLYYRVGVLIATSMFGLVIDIGKAIILPFTMIISVITKILPIPPSILWLISFIFFISLILAAWRLWKQGD